MNIGFVAVKTFIPSQSYIGWSKLNQIKEIITIDCALCPRILQYREDDYRYMTWMEDYWVYNDLSWFLKKVEAIPDKQILAVVREPKVDCKKIFNDLRFRFYGYDLIEDQTDISALTNCGGFDKAFHKADISKYGLIENFDRAKEVQLKLKEEYPYEDHADCALWGIWRMEEKRLME